MAHAAKYARSAIGHMAAHFERRKDEHGNYVKFSNMNIDATRTHLNYNLAPEYEGGQVAFIKQRTSEVRCLKRDDVNIMCTWIVTMPKPFAGTYGRLDGIHATANRERVESLFFERTYRFLADRYGEQNVISAYVHKDEVTPHVHFAFVPVTEDKKRGGYKVSAKEVLTKLDLQTFHGDLEHHHNSYRDWQFEVQNDATRDGNKTVAELKKETAHREVLEALQRAQEAHIKAETIQKGIEPLLEQKKGLESEIGALQVKKETLTAEEVQALKGTKTLTGGLKGVKYDEFQALKKTAAKVGRMENALNRALSRADRAEQQTAIIKKTADEAIEKAKRDNSPSIGMQMENAKLKKNLVSLKRENESLRGIMDKVINAVKSHSLELYHKVILPIIQPSANKQKNRWMDWER